MVWGQGSPIAHVRRSGAPAHARGPPIPMPPPPTRHRRRNRQARSAATPRRRHTGHVAVFANHQVSRFRRFSRVDHAKRRCQRPHPPKGYAPVPVSWRCVIHLTLERLKPTCAHSGDEDPRRQGPLRYGANLVHSGRDPQPQFQAHMPKAPRRRPIARGPGARLNQDATSNRHDR